MARIENQMVVGPYPTEQTSDAEKLMHWGETLNLPEDVEINDVNYAEAGQWWNWVDDNGTLTLTLTVEAETHYIHIAADDVDPDATLAAEVAEIKEGQK